ncbi:MAG: zinc ribbon domain-containing protein [Evtepia gabavorous]
MLRNAFGGVLHQQGTRRHPNEAYCKWCYADGTFTYSNLEELIAFLAGHLSNSHWPPEQVRAYFTELLPKLAHWRSRE